MSTGVCRRYGASMSFDLYFVSLSPGETFEDALGRMEEAAAEPSDLTTGDVERWQSVLGHVRPLLPNATQFAGASHRQLSDDATSIQLSLAPGELSLTIPYWYSGPEAQAMVERLRSVALAVEDATGLTAYDPQADAPFTGAGEQSAAARFDQVAAAFRHGPEPKADTGRPKRRGLFRRDR